MSSRESKIARQSVKSSVIVAAGNLISMVFLFLATLLVARLLGPASYGVYSLALAIPLFLQLLVGFGTRTAINRYSAYYISQGDLAAARRMTKNAALFLALTSSALTALSFVLAGWMSSVFLFRPELTVYIQAASVLILGQALYNFLTPAFIGWGIPLQDAIWTIVQAILKLAISVALILFGLGIFGALYGYVLSSLLAGILGILVLYITKLRNNGDKKDLGSANASWTLRDFVNDVREMGRYGLPMFTGNIILQFSQQPVLVVIISYIASNTIIGYYSAANNVTQIIVSFSSALTPAFFAAFASLDGIKSDVGTAFKHAVKYVSFFMMPLVIFLIATSGLVVDILFGRAYLDASYYLQLLTLSYLPYAFGFAVLGGFFNGVGKTRLTMFMGIVETFATLVPAFILILWLRLGVSGLLYSVIISNIAPTIYGLYCAKKYFEANVDYLNLIKTFLVAVLCSSFLYLLTSLVLIGVSPLLTFLIELVIFCVCYLTLMPLGRVVQTEDIIRLRQSSTGLGALSRFLDPLLDYESFLVKRIEKGAHRS